MSAILERAKFHKVFSLEQQGNILIVQPMGDAVGFRDSDVATELNTVLEILNHLGPVHLLIDLGSNNYFGSIIIGAMHTMASKVQEAGGHTAICDASPEMLDVLQIMKLDQMWMNFDTRKIALKALGKVE